MKSGKIIEQVDEREIEIILRELDRIIVNGIEGDVVEFGCYSGTTSAYLSKRLANTGKKLYVYDSFEGLPEKTELDVSPLSEQFKVGELRATKKQFVKNLRSLGAPIPVIKKAWFSQLRREDLPERIALAFLDGDYYESIRDSLRLIESKLVNGSIVIVDDYASQTLPGVKKAVDEWLRRYDARIRVEHSLALIKPAIKR